MRRENEKKQSRIGDIIDVLLETWYIETKYRKGDCNMIKIVQENTREDTVVFYKEKEKSLETLPKGVRKIFEGNYLQTAWITKEDETKLLLGMGTSKQDKIHVKELGAKAVKEEKEKGIRQFSVDVSAIIESNGIEAIRDLSEGAMLATYEPRNFAEKKDEQEEPFSIEFYGVPEEEKEKADRYVAETIVLVEGVLFARDMVNLPGNKLRPQDFAKEIVEFVKDTDIEAEIKSVEQLKEMGMEALLCVGESSEFPPCLLVLRYQGDPEREEVTGLVGKGVTCDTGGYCLKASNSMLGIKGDMAGGAAVSGAMYALAKNQVKTNVVAVIPMCENRISRGSLLPGDVIGSYSGKTIEIANTDAEGRLILADAVSYAIQKEKVTEVLDIATLTGAVVAMFGFSIAGVVCDNDSFFERFQHAYELSGERYWRLPFYEEHEKMIESKIANVRNMSNGGCGTITAGLFIREFAEGKPWLHLDIAGTAWVDTPMFEFQTIGATGAGVTSIYELCHKEEMS